MPYTPGVRRSALLFTLLATSLAQAAPRVSPRVRLVAEGVLEARALSDGSNGNDGRALVTVRVDGGAAALRALGFDAQAGADDIAIVRADAPSLARLSATPGVRNIEERHLLHPLLDKSVPATGAPAARVEAGIDGSGVLVGVIDSGVDFRHPDFRTADGHTRLAALLDFAQPPDQRHPEFGTLTGALYLRDEIDAQLAAEAAGMTPAVPIPTVDTNGHGTHVAGIAAGNGRGTSSGLPAGRYVGMAPGADLVVVQASGQNASFTDASVIGAAHFISSYADRVGKPVVVNISLGGSGGPHDGSSNIEAALDQLYYGRPGHAVAVAAGNDGTRDLHAHIPIVDREVILPIEVPKSMANGTSVSIDLWSTGRITLAVESPNGRRLKNVGPDGLLDTPVGSEARIIVDNRGLGSTPDKRVEALVLIAGLPNQVPNHGTWKIHVLPPAGAVDAWVADSPPDAPPAHFSDWVSEDDRLSLPATANGALAVGSFTTRSSWSTHDGRTITRSSATVGDISIFSSSGPTADGRFSPDVTAPGEFVISTLSRDTDPSMGSSAFFAPKDPGYSIADDGVHGILRGTSQASPHLTGAVALLFAVDPTLTAARVREILRITATPPSTGAAWTPREGFGRVDVLSAIRYLKGARGTTADAGRSAIAVSRDALPPGNGTTLVTVIARDAAGLPLGPGHTIELTTTAGEWAGPAVDLGEGRIERTLFAHATRGQVATISATVDGVALASTATVFFVHDRSEIGRPFVAGGGCTTTPSLPSARLPVGLLLLAFFALLRARRTLKR